MNDDPGDNRPEGVEERHAVFYAALLYVAGAVHWVYLFWLARFNALDWLLEARYHAILREALTRGKIPYLMNYAGHYSDRFLALPETPLSPQYLLLPFMGDIVFHHFNAILMYSVGFFGLLWIRKEFRIGALPFAFLFLLFHFNGYLVARIAAGQAMWYGYYFLPYFHVLAVRLLERQDAKRPAVAIVFVLAAMLLQGSFHLFFWCMMFLGLVLVFNPSHWRALAFVLGGAVMLNAYRLVPGAIAIAPRRMDLGGGYPSLGVLLDAITALKDFRESLSMGIFGHTITVYWWELDCFTGMTGFGLLFYFGLWRWKSRNAWRSFAGPCAVMFLLSLGMTYSIATVLNVPFAQLQRLPARFIVIPITFVLLVASVEMDTFLRDSERGAAWRVFLGICVALLAAELLRHSSQWRVADIESTPVLLKMEPVVSVAIRAPDWTDPGFRVYAAAFWSSLAVSCATGLALVRRFMTSDQ